MENPISITMLNDFVFCPVSIYFHRIDEDQSRIQSQSVFQINGTAAHKRIDEGEYSDKKSILQATSVYSETYNLEGKIDIFDIDSGLLSERKKHISKIYDGYVFQLYGQYFALKEMGYNVRKLVLHSLDDNKTYVISKPEEDPLMLKKFIETISNIREFRFEIFEQNNKEKCKMCIYEELCCYSKMKGDLHD